MFALCVRGIAVAVFIGTLPLLWIASSLADAVRSMGQDIRKAREHLDAINMLLDSIDTNTESLKWKD